MKFLTTYEASLKYHISTRHLRHLIQDKKLIKAAMIRTSKSKQIFLIDEGSLRKYMRNRPKPGRKPSRK